LFVIDRALEVAGLEAGAALKCRYAPLVHLIGLTRERKIAPYPWVHPDDDR